MDLGWPKPTPAKAGLRKGKTALMWHQLQRESAASGQPIQCVRCARVHEKPPPFGGCPCGSYGFEVQAAPPAAAVG
jgi:hypothetical protein